MAFAVIPAQFNHSTRILLKNVGNPMPNVLTIMAGNVVNVAASLLFVVHLRVGMVGLGFAWLCGQLITMTANTIYLLLQSDLREQGFVRLVLIDFTLCVDVLP